VSRLVRTVRQETGTPRTARSDTLELLERDGPANIAALAQQRNVKHQSMRLVTAQLEADGLIRRGADGNDGRSVLFSITPKGRKWLRDGRAARTDRIAERIAGHLTPAERATLADAVSLLARLADDDAAD
jgi:DNA-binding MarR family transcriptional regulator